MTQSAFLTREGAEGILRQAQSSADRDPLPFVELRPLVNELGATAQWTETMARATGSEAFAKLGIDLCDAAERLLQKSVYEHDEWGPRPDTEGEPEPQDKTRQRKDNFDRFIVLTAEIQRASCELQALYCGGSLENVMFGDPICHLLYLRGFETARRYYLENQYTGGDALVMPIEIEPRIVSLEAALHRALMARFVTMAVGGPTDIIAMGRVPNAFSAEPDFGWKEMVDLVASRTDAFLLMPSPGTGTQWEIRYVADQARDKLKILICLPVDVEPDMPVLWKAVQRAFDGQKPRVPDWTRDGFFFLSCQDRSQTIPFDSLFTGGLVRTALDVLRDIPLRRPPDLNPRKTNVQIRSRFD